MAHSRWNWVVFPAFVTVVYALVTWYVRVPLGRAEGADLRIRVQVGNPETEK